ncbi:hypothetical protein CHUAL_003547 [Chamberlinius hualienensis]
MIFELFTGFLSIFSVFKFYDWLCKALLYAAENSPKKLSKVFYKLLEWLQLVHDWFFKVKPIPGPIGFPLVGHLLHIDNDSPHLTFDAWCRQYGPIYQFKLGRMNVVALGDPEMITNVFSSESAGGRPPLFVTTAIMECCGVISVDRELWRNQRHIVAICIRDFLNHTVWEDNYYEILLNRTSDYLINKFTKQNDQRFDVHDSVSYAISNLMATIIFGISYEPDDIEFKRQLELCDEGASLYQINNLVNYYPQLSKLPIFGEPFERLRRNKSAHHTYLNAILQKHLTEPENVVHLIGLYAIEMDRCGHDLSHPRHRKQAIHVLADLFGASTDATKLTIKWALLYLVTRQDVQDLIHKELDEVIVGKPKLSDMSRLTYLKACIFETQRMASVVPIGTPHWTHDDIELYQYVIPKDTMVIALQYSIHHDPNYWKCPNVFSPARFIENGKIVHPTHFMPFSVGKFKPEFFLLMRGNTATTYCNFLGDRRCLGKYLAEQCLFFIMANIMYKFTILPPMDDESPDERPLSGFTLSPKGFKLRLVPRANKNGSL